MKKVYADQLPTFIGAYLRNKPAITHFSIGEEIEIGDAAPFVNDEDIIKLIALYGGEFDLFKQPFAQCILEFYRELLEETDPQAYKVLSEIANDDYIRDENNPVYCEQYPLVQLAISVANRNIVKLEECFENILNDSINDVPKRNKFYKTLQSRLRKELIPYSRKS
tara:strand:- start:4077 stop:4574 length:498 start_codon:yes stop_codon:yes gene_type:complete